MNIYLTITIDIEPDCSPTWHYANPLTFHGVHTGVKEILQPLFNSFGVIPTYLINNVVLEDIECVNVFRNLQGHFELGTHLHPEFIEPQKTVFHYAGSKGEANSCFYDPDIEYNKIKNITELFTDRFGYAPKSFRAGRFSAGPNTISSLYKLGYKVDTSVTPHINWCDKTREDPVDFSDAMEQPYWIKSGSILEKNGHPGVLEVPVSIIHINNHRLGEFLRTIGGIRRPAIKNRVLWLRPVQSKLNDLIRIIKLFNHNYSHAENIVLNMMFHNVEVCPGLSPYTISSEDSSNYMQILSSFFEYCMKNNIRFISLNGLSEIWEKNQ